MLILRIQGRNFNKFFGVSKVALRTFLSVTFFFLGPVSSPAEVHCTTVFALRSGKFSMLGGGGLSHPHTCLSFVPVHIAKGAVAPKMGPGNSDDLGVHSPSDRAGK